MLTLKYVRPVLFTTILLSLFPAIRLPYNAGINVSATMQQEESQQEERQLEISMPKHIPLRLKIKKEKEKEFKDLKNENWARDFELEVINVGQKPIYSFNFILFLDVKAAAGFRIVTPVAYGRVELSDHRVRATAEDVPLNSGESCILKIDAGQLQVWERARREEGRPHPKKVLVRFQNLSFGDGTGLMGPAGTPVPRKISGQSNLRNCGPEPSNSRLGLQRLASVGPPNLRQLSGLDLPARFLPVNFFAEAVLGLH